MTTPLLAKLPCCKAAMHRSLLLLLALLCAAMNVHAALSPQDNAAIRDAAIAHVQYTQAAKGGTQICLPMMSPGPAIDIEGVPGVLQQERPGQYAVTLLAQIAPELQAQRTRQIRQLTYLAAQGFFARQAIAVRTHRGVEKAWYFALTWQGYLNTKPAHGGDVPCFVVGNRVFDAVLNVEAGQIQGFPIAADYGVSYRTVVANRPEWVRRLDAAKIFPELAGLLREEGSFFPVTRIQGELQNPNFAAGDSGADSSGRALIDLLRGLTPPLTDDETVEIARAQLGKELGAVQSWCLPFRLQSGGDIQPQKLSSAGLAFYYFDAADRQPGRFADLAMSLHLLSALERAGFAEKRVVAVQPAMKLRDVGLRREHANTPGGLQGIRFTLGKNSPFAQLLTASSTPCLPLGEGRVERLQARFGELVVSSSVEKTPDWVLGLASDLPALEVVLRLGLLHTGSFLLRPHGDAAQWRFQGLVARYPELDFQSLPEQLETHFPKTASWLQRAHRVQHLSLQIPLADSVE